MKNKLSEPEKIIKEWIETQNVKALIKYLYGENATKMQCRIVQRIVFSKFKRILISAYTRYGKSQCVAWAVGLYVLLNENKIVTLVAPTRDKTKIIRDYVARAIAKCAELKSILQIKVTQEERMNKEVSKTKLTFSNGCVIQTISAEGTGQRLMGFGADLLIVDELAEIPRNVVTDKIMRMLGDDPENSIFVALFNPWSSDTVAYEYWHNPRYHTIYIPYTIGIEEGRTTQDYVDEKQEELSEIAFEVLFWSRFPKTTIDVILTPEQMKEAIARSINVTGTKTIGIGADIARFGNDSTVITSRLGFKVFDIQKYDKEDTMQTSGRICVIADHYLSLGYQIVVGVDDGGLGGGVTDRLNEIYAGNSNVTIIPINNGGAPLNKKAYVKKIDELWFWIKDHIALLDLPDEPRLIKEFSQRKYKYTSDGRKTLETKDQMKARGLKSPDVADSVSYSFISEFVQIEDSFSIGGFA